MSRGGKKRSSTTCEHHHGVLDPSSADPVNQIIQSTMEARRNSEMEGQPVYNNKIIINQQHYQSTSIHSVNNQVGQVICCPNYFTD